MSTLKEYLSDPLLSSLYQEIREAGPVRSISVDITKECNLRCKGCYYFEEEMDQVGESGENDFDTFIASEKIRGTNFVTVVGGEPAMALPRLKKLYENFKVNVATNGLIRIPHDGFENMPLGIAVWGDHETDSYLRGNGKRDLFDKALRNYKNDQRAFFYYTVAPGHSAQIKGVVEECIQNGNKVLFNYYSDITERGGDLDFHGGFEEVRNSIDEMIDLYPDHIYTTSYFNKVATLGDLLGEKWGYNVCTNLSVNLEQNAGRLRNGKPYNTHFRAYNADFKTTRRCCTGINRDCDSCFDTWEHFSWIMVNMRKHLGSYTDFTNWLTSMYLFYLINKFVEPQNPDKRLRELHGLGKGVPEKTFIN